MGILQSFIGGVRGAAHTLQQDIGAIVGNVGGTVEGAGERGLEGAEAIARRFLAGTETAADIPGSVVGGIVGGVTEPVGKLGGDLLPLAAIAAAALVLLK